jgi:transposase
MALFVGLDVSLKTVSICIVKADGSLVWEGKALSEPASLIKALARRRKNIQLVGIEACPLSEWLYGALVDSGFTTICIETRHAQRFLSSRPNKTDRSDARGIADMMRLGHYRPVHVKSRAAQLLRTTLVARKRFVDHMLAIEGTIRGLLKVHGLKVGPVHRCTFSARVTGLLENKPELRVAIGQRLKHRACATQIRCREALCKPLVHRCEELSRIIPPILPDSEAGKAEGSPQFPRQGTLLPGHLERIGEAEFSRRDGLIASAEQ